VLDFTYHVPTIIHFGKEQITHLSKELKPRAKKILLVYGKESIKKHGIYSKVTAELNQAHIPFIELQGINTNPHLSHVYKGIALCKENAVDFILAVGGGSVIDVGKAIAAGALYEGNVWDFFTNKETPNKALPLASVVTLAATGSEMNPNSVITNEKTHEKRAISAPCLRPVFSILDPEYTYSVNTYHTAAGIADIMAHIFEVYLIPIKHAHTQDTLAESLLRMCLRFGPIAITEPTNYEARATLLWTSSLALNGLLGKGKISDWSCHQIEHELSGYYDISHGAGLAIILPAWMQTLMKNGLVEKLFDYGTNVWHIKDKNQKETAQEAVKKTTDFFESIGLPSRLRQLNVDDRYFEQMAQSIIERQPSLDEFKQLSKKDIIKILEMSL
jgi:butanol dehydrogenase